MKKIYTSLFIFLAFCFNTKTNAQSLTPDALFGNNSFSTVFIDGGLQKIKLLRNEDNSLLYCGYSYNSSCNCFRNFIVKFDACGDIDQTFGENGILHHTFDQRNQGNDYILQADGKILCTGMQSDSNALSQQFPFVARYNSNGTIDLTFGTLGTNKITNVGSRQFQNIYLMPDGKILCNNGNFAMRFNENGTVDTSYAINGVMLLTRPANYWAYQTGISVLRPDGKIIAPSSAYNGTNFYLFIQAYDTFGNIDSTFGTNGIFIDSSLEIPDSNNIYITNAPNNEVIVAFGRGSGNGFRVLKLTSTGAIDNTFGNNGYIDFVSPITPSNLVALLPMNNDKFLVEYTENNISSNSYKLYDSNGSLDPSFSIVDLPTNFGNYGQVRSILQESNGDITCGANNQGLYGTGIVSRFTTSPSDPTLTFSENTLNTNVTNPSSTFQWFLNGTLIDGQTDNTLNITSVGLYSVEVTNIWGCTATDTINVTALGLNSVIDGVVSLYPNPSKGQFTVELPTDNAVITVTNLHGQQILKSQTSQKITNLQLVTNGIYFVQIKTIQGTTTKKLIINSN
jgi:uncharacterized delta-60 repeat protein